MKTSHLLAVVLLAGGALFGCDSNPTNEPAKAEIEEANAARLKAIENDKSLSKEGKEKMIEMLHLKGSRPAEKRGN